MKKAAISVLVVILWICPCFAGENIYTWTDKNGVKRFSDQPPPDAEYETITIPPDRPEGGVVSGGTRPNYEHMIESIRQEKLQTEQKRVQAEADCADKEKLDAEIRKKELIEAERKSLQKKIDDAKRRPTGRAFSQNVKNARIGEIEKQLERLKNSPDEYFQNR
jgi:hypothetical protein